MKYSYDDYQCSLLFMRLMRRPAGMVKLFCFATSGFLTNSVEVMIEAGGGAVLNFWVGAGSGSTRKKWAGCPNNSYTFQFPNMVAFARPDALLLSASPCLCSVPAPGLCSVPAPSGAASHGYFAR